MVCEFEVPFANRWGEAMNHSLNELPGLAMGAAVAWHAWWGAHHTTGWAQAWPRTCTGKLKAKITNLGKCNSVCLLFNRVQT